MTYNAKLKRYKRWLERQLKKVNDAIRYHDSRRR